MIESHNYLLIDNEDYPILMVSLARTGGYTFSILQLEASSFFNSEIDLNSSGDTVIHSLIYYYDLFPSIQYQFLSQTDNYGYFLHSISSMYHFFI
jgi:hypothetical protein